MRKMAMAEQPLKTKRDLSLAKRRAAGRLYVGPKGPTPPKEFVLLMRAHKFDYPVAAFMHVCRTYGAYAFWFCAPSACALG